MGDPMERELFTEHHGSMWLMTRLLEFVQLNHGGTLQAFRRWCTMYRPDETSIVGPCIAQATIDLRRNAMKLKAYREVDTTKVDRRLEEIFNEAFDGETDHQD